MNCGKKYGQELPVIFGQFKDQFGDNDIEDVTPDEILAFLTHITEDQKQSTKRFKYALLKSFFNFTINTAELDVLNVTPIGTKNKFKDAGIDL